jgi:hypothetical protein
MYDKKHRIFINEISTLGIIFMQLIDIPCIGEHATVSLYQHISPWCNFFYYDEMSFPG